MDNQNFPEDLLPPDQNPPAETPEEIPSSSVDFSDLGPLFSPAEDTKDPGSPEDLPEDSFEPLSEDPLLQEDSPQDPSFEEALPEEVYVEEDIPEEEPIDLQRPDGIMDHSQPEAPVYQAQDYPGALDAAAPEDAVLPGEAAWLLKKLRELPEDEAQPQAEEPSFAEEASFEEEAPQEETPVFPEEYDEIPEDIPQDEMPELQPEDIPQEEIPQQEIPQEVPTELPQEQPPQGTDLAASQQESAELQEPAEEAPEAPKKRQRKGRPKHKKGEGFFGIPNLAVTAVWIAITLLIGVTLGRMVWICAADVLAFGRENKPVTVTIYEADTIDDITQKLYSAELIRYPGLFKLYASLAVDEGEIHPGIWDLNTLYDYHALVNMMSPSSSREVVEVMIPEGYSCRQIFDLMEEKKICTALDLAAYAANGELDDYWFLSDVERGDMYCLEGFLFPDTYQFYKNDSPRNVLQKMLGNFENRFDQDMQAQIDALNAHLSQLMATGGHGEDYIASHQFDVRDVVIVASLIEKETSSAEEGYTIASVIYNRLYNWGDNPPLLNIDAAIVYALGGKTDLTAEDLKVDSPYNTYLHQGLTPGPISNPGLASLRAALNPQDTNYYFYVLDPALGSHRFTTTYEEHQAAKASVGG